MNFSLQKRPKKMKRQPLASISLDLDNQWSYMKTHGDPGWKEYPSYLNFLIPNVLDLLEKSKLKITFFIVGQDAALEKNQDALKLISEKGHEIGNHSFHHEPWLRCYEKNQIEDEILKTENHIIAVTGQKPIGFRGPGFAWSPALFEVLSEKGYIYDASTFPTFLGPLARLYYFWKAKLTDDEKEQRKELFGGLREGFRSVKSYFWQLDSGNQLLEIPVTTMPFIKVPFHLSYLLYISQYSVKLMKLYLKTALFLCRITKTEPSFLLHPLDFLDASQIPELSFFPGMRINREKKTEIFQSTINMISKYFDLVDMSTYAQSTSQKGNLKVFSANPY